MRTTVQDEKQPTVAVVGLGYIGLPTATVLATHGCRVIGVDIDPGTVASVDQGRVPFVEPGLEEQLAAATSGGALTAQSAMPPADVYVIAVPTPFLPGFVPDLRHVFAAADAVAAVVGDGGLVVLESTSPPGTTEEVARRILDRRPDLGPDGSDGRGVLHVVHCPERVLPGRIMTELVTNDRVVGGLTPAAGALAQALYRRFCTGEILVTDARTAELVKLVENSFRDVNIAFANEVAAVCERLGPDPWEVIRLANHHPRVQVLDPGPGVGGHCIAVDPWFLVAAAPEETPLIRTAREVNLHRPVRVVEQVLDAVGRHGVRTLAVLGLAFKPDVDDLRESPAVEVVRRLLDGCDVPDVLVAEPHVTALPPGLAGEPRVRLVDVGTALAEADLVVQLVDHTPFRAARVASRSRRYLGFCPPRAASPTESPSDGVHR